MRRTFFYYFYVLLLSMNSFAQHNAKILKFANQVFNQWRTKRQESALSTQSFTRADGKYSLKR